MKTAAIMLSIFSYLLVALQIGNPGMADQAKQAETWQIYLFNQPFWVSQIQSRGKLFVEEKPLVKALSLNATSTFSKNDKITQKGITYVWLPAAVKLSTATLLINKDTRTIDIARLKAASKNLGSPTIVVGGSSAPQTSAPFPTMRGGGGY